jgi:putative colanic acid biosynthesis acetyltransferase WcaF
MKNKQVNLNKYNNSWYQPAGTLKKTIWYFTNMFVFKTNLPIPSSIKVKVLRLFGAKVGKAVVIKPNVNIKYPWLLEIDDFTWIGEDVWIDNLAKITIGKNCVLSQGSFLLCGFMTTAFPTFAPKSLRTFTFILDGIGKLVLNTNIFVKYQIVFFSVPAG